MTATRRGVTEEAAVAAVDSACRLLRLPTIRSRFGEIASAAEREQLTYLGFLAELVMAECDDRDKRRSIRQITAAGFPRPKRIEEFDFAANTSITPAVINQLATCAWVKTGQPLCLIGDSGTGKTHLLIALGTAAAEKGYRVRYTLASKLVNELVEAADEKQLSTAESTSSASTNLATWNSTAAAPNCCSRSSPNEKRSPPSPSPPTKHSQVGRRPSPTPGSAPPSSTDSPSPVKSSKPGPPATGSPTPEPQRASSTAEQPIRTGPDQTVTPGPAQVDIAR
jgi:hypothetical protein